MGDLSDGLCTIRRKRLGSFVGVTEPDPESEFWLRCTGLRPRGMFWEPRTFEALLTGVCAGNKLKLGSLGRGEVARRRGRGKSGEGRGDAWFKVSQGELLLTDG